MSGVVKTVKGVVGNVLGFGGDSPQEVAANEAQANRAYQQAMWERQFGPVNDMLLNEMRSVLGYNWVPPSEEKPDDKGTWEKAAPGQSWLDKFKATTRSEIESGIRPGEEAARIALLDKVRANPRAISSQAYAKGLKDIVTEGAKARGTAYRSGMTSAELTPLNLAMTFMGRTPFAPNVNPVYSPDYKLDTAGLKMAGGGLLELAKAGKNLYGSIFGPRETSESGFEQYMGDAGGNLGMGDLSDLEEGMVF